MFSTYTKETKVSLSSPWKTPSFEGNFFPDFREINDTCF
ncbi:hypothetical protein DLM75_00105 [Leptospira stimsonii]|uniref:Uncharacterized protein n=1 Tax=Leptospira stimsonii TaxID=2202203 RepID=A0A396Z8J4_9LEPT|nr:hypothetical protein DLM75_00105 [Leptospira stimsonii]